jgi:hypothetical protein
MTNELDKFPIRELLGKHFYIPHYQRGYRWTKRQVEELLDDIFEFANTDNHNAGSFYCLQPIVVAPRDENQYEVIDGQQRLTTLYIIIQYLAKDINRYENFNKYYGNNIYTLEYETRKGSELFLENITSDNSNIDYYHIYNAYQAVDSWLNDVEKPKDIIDRERILNTILGKKEDRESVQIIWYNIQESIANKEELFNRLNNGKIPLTNAELVKALFLAEESKAHGSNINNDKQMQIAYIWDTIEQELHNENFWYFITNQNIKNYQSKIEIILDVLADTPRESKDPLHTFLYFLESKKKMSNLWQLWLEIENCFLTLKQWFTNRDDYHQIGYLITTGAKLNQLVKDSMNETKDNFKNSIYHKIYDSIPDDFECLEYGSNSDNKKIEKILTLFNIESIRQNGSIDSFYPFKFHKNTHWSLEHIEAQNAEGISKTDKNYWYSWIQLHKPLLTEYSKDVFDEKRAKACSAILKRYDAINTKDFSFAVFEDLFNQTIEAINSNKNSAQAMHNISNLALLSVGDNAVLNNAVFEVKRRFLIELDKEGRYIPICTKRAFFKYYSVENNTNENASWTNLDRRNYIENIKKTIAYYGSNK